MTSIPGHVEGEDPFLPEGLHHEFHFRRKLLEPSDEMVCRIMDGGETAYAKVRQDVERLSRSIH